MSREKVARLEILGHTFPVYDGMNIVGRDLEASIIIRNLRISKLHAIISVIGDKHFITDFNSSNGCTIKNETLVPFKFYEIQDKTNIILGDVDAIYYIGTSPSTESQDGPFLKPSIPKHIHFASTVQVIEAKNSVSQDDTHLAATQLLTEENQQTNLNNSNVTLQNKIFSLLSTTHDKTNNSNEIVFCDESLEENFKDPFTREKLDESTEIPATQECFSKKQNDSLNDCSIIPATQDVNFENIHQGSSNKAGDSQDATQIENYDSDATDIEEDNKVMENHFCFKNVSPVPSSELIINDLKNLSDDEDIDFYENNEFNPNVTSTEVDTNINNSENSNLNGNCEEETENLNVSNKNNESCITHSVPETEEFEFIPDTQDFENIQAHHIQPNQQKELSAPSDKVSQLTNSLNTSTKLSTFPIKNTQQEQNMNIRKEDDVFFIGATQDIINSNCNVDSKSNQVKNSQNIPKFQFKPLSIKTTNENIPENNQVENNKFDAPTELLKLPEKSEFNERSSIPKLKSQESDKFLNDDNDMYFVGATQDILKNSGEIRSYSDQCNDGIPEMPCFDVEMCPEKFAESRYSQNKEAENDGVSEKDIENPSKSPSKASEMNQNPLETTKMVDFSAPTQLIDPKNSIAAPKDSNLLPKSTQNQNNTKDTSKDMSKSLQNLEQKKIIPIDYDAETQIIVHQEPPEKRNSPKDSNLLPKSTQNQNNTKDTSKDMSKSLQNLEQKKIIPIDYDAETQIIVHQEPPEKRNSPGKVRNDLKNRYPDFSAPTQKLMTSAVISDSEMFVAPTQELLNNVSPKGNNNSSKSLEMSRSKDFTIFMAPTQELLEGSGPTNENIPQDQKDSTDSEGSDVILSKKGKPKVIKEIQEETAQSDSDLEISYKKKKCLPILESQTQGSNEDHQILSNTIKNRTNDSAVISDLEETQESMRLIFSNTSINVSSQSINTSNKDGDTHLEINLPTQKEFLLSQNNRPSNPLVQVLDVEKQTSDLNELKNSEEICSNKYRTKKFVYDLEPTQIFEEKLDETFAEVPDSDPEDYTEFCDMDTQPIGGISLNLTSPIKEDPKIKKPAADISVPEIHKPNKRRRKSKKNENIFVQPTTIVLQNQKDEATSSRSIRRRSTPKKEEIASIAVEKKMLKPITSNKDNPLEIVDTSSTSKENKLHTASEEENLLEGKTIRRSTKKKQNITNELKVPKSKKKTSKQRNLLETVRTRPSTKPNKKSNEVNTFDGATTSRRGNFDTRRTRRSSTPKKNETIEEEQNVARPQKKSNETNHSRKKAISSAKISEEGNELETRTARKRSTPKKEEHTSNVEEKEKPRTKKNSKEFNPLAEQVPRKELILDLEEQGVEQSTSLARQVPIPKGKIISKAGQNQKVVPVIEVQKKRGKMFNKEENIGKENQEENIAKELPKRGKRRTPSEENLAVFVEQLQQTTRGNKEDASTSKRSIKASSTERSEPVKATSSKIKDTAEEIRMKEKDVPQEEKPNSRITNRGTLELIEMKPKGTRGKFITKEESTSTRRKRASTIAQVIEEAPSTSKRRATSVTKEVQNQIAEVQDSSSTKKSTRGQSILIKEPTTSKNTLDKELPSKKGTTSNNKQKTSKKTTEDKPKFTEEELVQENENSNKEHNDDKNKKKQNTRKKTKLEPLPSENETPTKKPKTSHENIHDVDLANQSTRREVRTKHKIVFTMLDDTNLEATVGRLGGKTVDSSQECTVLVTSKISRSLKFLVAVSLGKPIVGPNWVRTSGQVHKFLDPWDYILKDNETETQLNFKLREAIEKGSRTKLFDGYIFLILVNKNFDVIKNVIVACGGEVVNKVPKNNTKSFMIISYPEDKSKYNRYLKQKPPVTVVGAEAIFAGALQQKLILDQHYLQ